MRICVVGAGAIGGLLACKLSLAGHEVSVLARGEHLDAIRTHGIKVIESNGDESVATDIAASEKLAELGRQEVILLALKAHQIIEVAGEMRHLYGPETVVVTLQNGIPWWYFQLHGGRYDGRSLPRLDPDGTLSSAIPAERIVGCIAYPSAVKSAAGVITHVYGDRFPLGELNGERSNRARAVAAALKEAGFKSRVLADIRAQIWVKAYGNLAFNPLSALTGGTLVDLCATPAARELATAMMTEAARIAEALGVSMRLNIEQRIEGAAQVGRHKTSMLQDAEAGRALEIEPVVGVFLDLAEIAEVEAPTISTVYALTATLNKLITDKRVLPR